MAKYLLAVLIQKNIYIELSRCEGELSKLCSLAKYNSMNYIQTNSYLKPCKKRNRDSLWCRPQVLRGSSKLCGDVARYLLRLQRGVDIITKCPVVCSNIVVNNSYYN